MGSSSVTLSNENEILVVAILGMRDERLNDENELVRLGRKEERGGEDGGAGRGRLSGACCSPMEVVDLDPALGVPVTSPGSSVYCSLLHPPPDSSDPGMLERVVGIRSSFPASGEPRLSNLAF